MKSTRTYTLAILMLCSATAWAGSYTKTIPISGQADVTVNVRSGDLTITGWSKSEILIESKENLEKYIKVDGSQVRIGPESTGPEGIDEDVTIQLPANAQLKVSDISGELKIEGINGRLKITVISGDAKLISCQGSVSIKSVSGDVKISKVAEGLNIKSVSGDLKISDIQGGLLEAKTVSGEITLRNIRTNQVRLKTVSGEIELQGQFPADGQIKASTLSGDVIIILPANAAFDLQAKSRSGSAKSGFNLQVVEKSDGWLLGKAGSGGTDIDLNSFSGDLRVKPGK